MTRLDLGRKSTNDIDGTPETDWKHNWTGGRCPSEIAEDVEPGADYRTEN